jgi:5'-nucleotidase
VYGGEDLRILLTNDDGVDSPGIHVLAERLAEKAEVLIVVPQEEKSGASHSLTLGAPVEYREFRSPSGIAGFVVKGTPVDCVRLAHDAFGEHFDMVVSGINAGANVGLNIHYSGTVAAALEAAFIGRIGLAVSISSRKPRHNDHAARLAADLAGRMLERGEKLVVNLNVPDLPPEEIRGVRITKTSLDEEETVLAMYAGQLKNDRECEGPEYVIDSRAVAAGFVSITPLQLDMTACGALENLRVWGWNRIGE